MSEQNKHYRFKAAVNEGENSLNININQSIDKFEILSLTINQTDNYRLMNSGTGLIIGRVLANGGFGIPNAKVSVFIPYDDFDDFEKSVYYNFSTTTSIDYDGIRYNLLPKETNDDCHQDVGTFPTKRYVLDNDNIIEIFDKYYKFTTRTNNSGDYMIYGVPTGTQTVHCDIDLSDIGVLSQRPSDMIYKGSNINYFESPSKFKYDTNLNSLAQIITEDNVVFVQPFWGDTTDGAQTNAVITRCDININYKFEPTCVFIGSVITDTGENAISKKCIASKQQGKMSDLITGDGTIEMIRKTPDGLIEQFSIKGNQLIDSNGVWCYQIPMNLDYVVTDEYGNTVLSDDPNKGIATRTRVRFRIGMSETITDITARKRARFLVPNNPKRSDDYPKFVRTNKIDYEFGSRTSDEDFRDLMWNNVYTVKSYIPRLQKKDNPDNKKFTGIKTVNHPNGNNPMPYNSLGIKMTFMYRFICKIIKAFVRFVGFLNIILSGVPLGLYEIAVICGKASGVSKIFGNYDRKKLKKERIEYGLNRVKLENVEQRCQYILHYCYNKDPLDFTWIGARSNDDESDDDDSKAKTPGGMATYILMILRTLGYGITLKGLCENDDGDSLDITPRVNETLKFKLNEAKKIGELCDNESKVEVPNNNVSELMNCVENQLIQDSEITSFNFYNDWVNGVLYFPLWYRRIKPKRKFLGIKINSRDQWCNSETKVINSNKAKKQIKLYSNMVPKMELTNDGKELKPLKKDTNPYIKGVQDEETGSEVLNFYGTEGEDNGYGFMYHKKSTSYTPIESGIIVEKETMLGDLVYYYKPVYVDDKYNNELVTLFATDIVLLGSLSTCDLHGVPQFFKALESTTYNMPPDLLSDYNSSEDDDSTRTTEYTGADWGNLGYDQSNKTPEYGYLESNTNLYDNGGLFYGIDCDDSYTRAKSCVNIRRICEFGISLDESQELLTNKLSEINDNDTYDDYTELIPDGFVSYDEIYNMDYRSMFATMNNNGLKTIFNYKNGLCEYDFKHMYIDNFDGLMSNLMQDYTVMGTTEKSGFTSKANYSNNYKLEKSSSDYINFRYGDNIYYYTYTDGRIPRFENSFYFYFGLKNGSSAIDYLRRYYYSDCKTDDTASSGYDIEYKGNTWCNDINDGYIIFDTNFEAPIIVRLIDANENMYQSEISNSNTFYIGYENRETSKNYDYIKLYKDGIECRGIPSGTYDIILIDGNENEYNEKIEFYSDKLTADIEAKSFNCKNSDLIDMFAVNDANGNIDLKETYSAIANYKIGQDKLSIVKSEIRPILGYIYISDVSIDNYIVTITPKSNFFGENYKGIKLVVKGIDVNVNEGGVGLIEFTKDDRKVTSIMIGVPYANQKYNIKIAQLCDDIETENSLIETITINEGIFKMYLNGIDYDIIKSFKTGWDDDRVNVSTMKIYVSENNFNSDNIYGWNDLSNIGKYYNGVEYEVISNIDISNVTKDKLREYLKVLSVEYNGNGVKMFDESDIEYSTPYVWDLNYCIDSDNIIKFINIIDNWDGSTITDDIESIIENINNIISNRIDFSNRVKSAFRVGYIDSRLNVSYYTSNPPVKYLMVGYLLDNDFNISKTDNKSKLNFKNEYTIIDKNLELNFIQFSKATITYENEWKVYKEKLPYYVGLKNKLSMTVPGKALTTTTTDSSKPIYRIDMFENPDEKYVYPGKLFGVHFINKPMYFIPTNGWSSVDSIPLYKCFDEGENKYVSINGFVKGYAINGVKKPLLSYNGFDDIRLNLQEGSVDSDTNMETKWDISIDPNSVTSFPIEDGNKEFIELKNTDNPIVVDDEYSEKAEVDVYGDMSISLDDNLFMYVTRSGDDEYSTDTIKANVNGANGKFKLYLFKYVDDNYPLFNVEQISSENSDIYGYREGSVPDIYNCTDLTDYNGFVSNANNNGYFTIGKNYNGNLTENNSRYFIIAEQNNIKAISPIIDYSRIRVYSLVKGVSNEKDNQDKVIYITNRVKNNNDVYDIADSYYLNNYDFDITLYSVDGSGETSDAIRENLTMYETYTVPFDGRTIVDVTLSDNGVEYHNKAIKIELSNSVINSWSGFGIRDVTGVERWCHVATNMDLVEEKPIKDN